MATDLEASRHYSHGRVMGYITRSRVGQGVVAGVLVALALAACGNTRRAPKDDGHAEGGAGSPPASGGTESGGSGTAGSRSGSGSGSQSGSGGAPTFPNGGEGPDAAGGAPSAPCVDGAACQCGKLPGVLRCGGTESASAGECDCPPKDTCRQEPRGSCFEPCGGDARGTWLLEETCFAGKGSPSCGGATLETTTKSGSMVIHVEDYDGVGVVADLQADFRARVPLSCLGIESVNRCVDADFYASPSFFGPALPLDCAPTDCGVCECAAEHEIYGGGTEHPWEPGSSTLPFGEIDVPYCVDGDTMWAGGGEVAGEPKLAFKLRRRSCVGAPKPCTERPSEECSGAGDCTTGRCLPNTPGSDACDGLWQESCDYATEECHWVAGGCWGTAAEWCDYAYCEAIPGCSWGAPAARCAGEPRGCYDLGPDQCDSQPGCSLRTCEVMEGLGGVYPAPCQQLSASACAKAVGCTLSGGACTGTTTCSAQTDPTACSTLGCDVYPLTCGGMPTTVCSEVSVGNCSSYPGCRLRW